MNVATHENGVQIRFEALTHRNFTADSSAGGVAIPSLGNVDRIRRVVLRNLGAPVDISFTGGDPVNGFRLLADEITVFDGDPTLVRVNSTTGSGVPIRAVLMGL